MSSPVTAGRTRGIGERRREPELMDEPELEEDLHIQALRALARVNRVSGTADRIWKEVTRAHERAGRPVRLLDVACGGGDVLLAVGRRAAAARVGVELHGVDVSERALGFARSSLEAAGLGADLRPTDVVAEGIPGEFDLVTCSLFLHHLSNADAVELLAAMARAARDTLLVQDLRRTRLGYLFAFAGLHLLTRSGVARVDGLRSVRAAYTLTEAAELATAAGLVGASVEPAWPQRFTIRWRRS